MQSLGADQVVDRTTNYENDLRGLDAVLDAYGPEAQERSWKLLKKGGILASIVTQPSEEEAAKHGVKAVRVFGNPKIKTLAHADELFTAGKLKIFVTKTYKLAQAVEALKQVGIAGAQGKTVLDVSAD